MFGKLFKTLIWWAIVAAIIIFFLQGNTIDSPASFATWLQESAERVSQFFQNTSGQVDLTDVNLNGEEIDVPKESE
jgi:ABC-type phosphate/phosphonate transport system permease subunit